MVGSNLSHYKVLEKLSRGGMGIVYRVLDVNLDREVALNVLPPELIANPERKRRFVQKAKAAARLDHPHIGMIFEIDEHDGVTFIAMELIRGEKLKDIVDREKLPLTRALTLASEVAEGLARAHDKGIVHRDLKPANIMVTEDGHAKIIDFGLAKLIEPMSDEGSDVETAIRGDTEPGKVMGTLSYMSPEQARGAAVDHRTDIFSFGIVLYDMLTGEPPFKAPSGPEVLAAIINAPTPRLGSSVSGDGAPESQRIIDKCLAKNPDHRYQTMKDLVVDLRALHRRLESGAVSSVSDPSPSIAVLPFADMSPAKDQDYFCEGMAERRVLLEEGDNTRYVPTGHLIYAIGETLLALPFDLESLQVTGGGVPIIENVLRDRFNSAVNFKFSNTGSLVYIPARALLEKETLAWIDREGFAVPAMVELSEAFSPDPYTPRFSPDGKQLAVNHAFEDIWVYDLSRGTRIRLTDEGMNIRPVWSPDGSLIAFSTSRRGKLSLFAKPPDGSGETKALSTSGSFMSPNSWSADGRLLAFYDLQGDIGVLSVDGQHKPQTVIATTFFEHSPMFSPNGRWLAYVSNESGQDEIYIQAYPDSGGKWSISTGGGQEPLWSSDGRELYYRNGDQIMAVPIDTRDEIVIGKPKLLFEAHLATGARGRYFYDVSPDGQLFAIVKRSEESRPAEIHVVLNWFEELKRLVPPEN